MDVQSKQAAVLQLELPYLTCRLEFSEWEPRRLPVFVRALGCIAGGFSWLCDPSYVVSSRRASWPERSTCFRTGQPAGRLFDKVEEAYITGSRSSRQCKSQHAITAAVCEKVLAPGSSSGGTI